MYKLSFLRDARKRQGSDMTYQYLKIESNKTERGDKVLTVSLNRPDKGNSLSIDLMKEITEFALSLNSDTDTRVVVFRGEGKHFCTGADLGDPKLSERNEQSVLKQMRSLDEGPNMIKAIYQIPQITFASLKGLTLGGGACIASACDFRIGTNNCKLGYPEANYGMNLSWLGLPLCTHLVGPAKAKRLVILGNHEAANDLLNWGMIDELVEENQLDAYCQKQALEYAKQAPVAAQMIKKSTNQIVSALDHAIMHMDKDQFLLTTQTEDCREGIMAFLQKREPDFKGN